MGSKKATVNPFAIAGVAIEHSLRESPLAARMRYTWAKGRVLAGGLVWERASRTCVTS